MTDDMNAPDAALAGMAANLVGNLPFALVLVDPFHEDLPIVYVNRAFERMTGYAASSVIGRNCRFLQGDNRDQEARHALRKAIEARESCRVDIRNYRADGTEFLNRLLISPVYNESGALFTYMGIQSEGIGTGDAAAERDDAFTRLRETEHRVKNHLAMVASMIRLEGRKAEAAAVFDILSRRVETLSLLYDEFSSRAFSGTSGDVVSAGGYVSRVAATVGALDGRKGIRLNVDTDTVYMRSDDAAGLGLLVSEVLSNTFKHAFEGRSEGLIEVRLKMQGNDVMRLTVSDDGVGMDSDWPKTGNHGAEIVRSLVEKLGARLTVDTGLHGTIILLNLPYAMPTVSNEDGERRVVAGADVAEDAQPAAPDA